MITSPRRPPLSPPVTRHFEFTRLHESIDRACISCLDPGRLPSPGTAAISTPATTSRPQTISGVPDPRPGELDQPCPITISVWRSTPGSPANNRPRRTRSPARLEAVTQRIANDGLECDPELRFVDDGVSGSILVRPGLERLRDQAAAGAIDRLYVLDPDRFSRKYAYQVLILEELARCGVEVVFLRNPVGRGPEENLLLQVQGMIAEYERAKIMERCRRGKQHAARRGSVNVLSGAPYGYRYVGKHEGGGEARYQVVAEEARVVRKIFEWVGQERCSIGEVCRRLQREGVPTRTGKSAWDRSVVWADAQEPRLQGDGGVRQDARGRRSSRNGSGRSGAAPSSPGARSHGSIHHRKIKSSSRSPGW